MVSRADHRRATLLRLGDAAVRCFDTDGPAATMSDIAEVAGVSRRTVFRWVETKEELAFVHPILWLDVFDAHLGDGSPATRIRAGARAVARHIDADPTPPRTAFLVAVAHPELGRGFTTVFQRWVDRIVEVVLEDGPADPDAAFRARVLGSAVMGMVDATTRAWLVGTEPFEVVHERGLVVIEPLLDAVDRRP